MLKFRFWSKITRNRVFLSKLFKKLDFGRNLSTISILVKVCENLILGRNVLKFRFWSKFYEHLDFGRNIREKLNF